MKELVNLLESENGILILFYVVGFLVFLTIINIILLIVNNRKYISFMKKMGNGNNLDEMLKKYLSDVREIKKDNDEIKAYYTKLDSDISSCVQKIGIVRYNAFRNVGSDLSFAVALLDRYDNGVVINGLYGSETSNVYAKPIKNGKSTYVLSEEEQYAIDIAEQNKKFVAKRRNFK